MTWRGKGRHGKTLAQAFAASWCSLVKHWPNVVRVISEPSLNVSSRLFSSTASSPFKPKYLNQPPHPRGDQPPWRAER